MVVTTRRKTRELSCSLPWCRNDNPGVVVKIMPGFELHDTVIQLTQYRPTQCHHRGLETTPSPSLRASVRGAVVAAVGKDKKCTSRLSMPVDNGAAALCKSIDPSPRYSTGRPILETAATWNCDLTSRRRMISRNGSDYAQEDQGIILFTPLVSQ